MVRTSVKAKVRCIGQCMNLEAFLKDYRALVNKGEASRLQRMFMLVELKPLAAVWQRGPYISWRGFLREEQLCSQALYERFEKATQEMRRKDIERLGVDAACALIRVEPRLRPIVIEKIDAYIKTFKQPPSNMMIWRFVRAITAIPIGNLVHRKGRYVSTTRH